MATTDDSHEDSAPRIAHAGKPWAAEVAPGPEEIVAALRVDFPGLECASIVSVGEGWNSFAYLVDDRWLFRFPKRADVERNLAREIHLLPELALALPVSVPNFTHVAEHSEAYPFLYAGYEKMEGTFAWEIDRTALDASALAASCAGFLTSLHQFPLARAATHGCVEQLTCTHEEIRTRIADTLGRIPPWPDREQMRVRVETLLDRVDARGYGTPPALTLVHTDLLPDHLLLDDGAAMLRGVIDWGEVRIDDPAWDFAGLVYWMGMPFARTVLGRYGNETDEGLLARARLIALEVGLGDVWYGLDGGARAYFEVGRTCVEHCLVDP